MSYNCALCNYLNTATLICTTDNEKFCENCIEIHLKSSNAEEHKFQSIELYEEEKFKEEQRNLENSQRISEALRQKITKENESIDKHTEEIYNLLQSKKILLHSMIDDIIESQLDACYDVRDKAKMEMTLLLRELSSDYSHNSELSSLVDRFQSIEDTLNLTFLEIRNPTHSESLSKALKQELNYTLQYYPYGKPIPLVYFKPVSRELYIYSGISNSLNKIEMPSHIFKDYPAYCTLPDNTILYSGGWINNASSSEVVLIDPKFKEIESKPSLKTPRHQHSMVFYNGTAYVFGGATATGITNSSEKWVFGENQWKSNGFMLKPKAQMGICILNGIIYISGENDIESFNIETNEYKELPVLLEGKLLSILVPRQNSFLMFRGAELKEIEVIPRLIDFVVSPIKRTEWWSPTQPIWLGSQIFIFTDYSKTIYCYDMRDKNLYLANSFRQ